MNMIVKGSKVIKNRQQRSHMKFSILYRLNYNTRSETYADVHLYYIVIWNMDQWSSVFYCYK